MAIFRPVPKPDLPTQPSFDGSVVLDDVTCWRFECFLRMGLPPSDAEEHARDTTNVHATEKLIDAGCPPVTAARITR